MSNFASFGDCGQMSMPTLGKQYLGKPPKHFKFWISHYQRLHIGLVNLSSLGIFRKLSSRMTWRDSTAAPVGVFFGNPGDFARGTGQSYSPIRLWICSGRMIGQGKQMHNSGKFV